jgi:serine/threonine-protein kinase RsbT
MQDYEAAVSNIIIMAEFWNIDSQIERDLVLNPSEPELTLDYELESRNYIKAGKASSDVKLFLKKVGVDPAILRKIAIACYEAEINVVAHSNGGKLTAHIYNDRVLIIFEDVGPGIEDIEKALQPGFSTADDLAREMGFGAGLGLPNILKNCNIMHLTSAKGCKTRLEFIVFFKE